MRANKKKPRKASPAVRERSSASGLGDLYSEPFLDYLEGVLTNDAGASRMLQAQAEDVIARARRGVMRRSSRRRSTSRPAAR
jgi:hypothetical protein